MDESTALPSPPTLESLLAGEPVALFLDFDGTLVEIAPAPDAIKPVAGLCESLSRLSRRLDSRVALVSGRGIDDIVRHIGPVQVAAAGSHGSDIRDASGCALGEAPVALPAELERALRSYAREHDIQYEEKPHGGAMHYRSAPDKGPATDQFARALAKEHGWHAQSGKCVVELVKGQSDKGSAVRTFMQAPPFAGSMPIFIGDDLTDEAGFAACIELGGKGILIGDRTKTHATYRLPDVASVHHWLEL